MKKTEFDALMSDVLSSLRLKEIHIDEASENLEDMDHKLRKNLFTDYDYVQFFHELTDQVTLGHPIIYEDSFRSYYLVYQNLESEDAPVSYTIAGPFAYEVYAVDSYPDLLQMNGLPLYKMKDLHAFLSLTTIMPEARITSSLFDALLARQGIANSMITHISYKHTLRESITEDHLSILPTSTTEYSALEQRYAIEKHLLQAVRNGNAQEAIQCSNAFMRFKMKPRVADPLREAKDMILAVNTLLRIAAEEAYVHPLYIDDLNAKLTTEIEAFDNIPELDRFCQTIIRRYCMLVLSYSRSQYSKIIRDTMNYVDFHFEEPLSLAFFADRYNITKNHLSATFHKEVGMTLTDYINTARIKRSFLLLNTSTLTIEQIAESCGFSDANYFTRIFKKMQGTSPSAYRKSLHNRTDNN